MGPGGHHGQAGDGHGQSVRGRRQFPFDGADQLGLAREVTQAQSEADNGLALVGSDRAGGEVAGEEPQGGVDLVVGGLVAEEAQKAARGDDWSEPVAEGDDEGGLCGAEPLQRLRGEHVGAPDPHRHLAGRVENLLGSAGVFDGGEPGRQPFGTGLQGN